LSEEQLLLAIRNEKFSAVVLTDLHQEDFEKGIYGDGFAKLSRSEFANDRWEMIRNGPFRAFIVRPDRSRNSKSAPENVDHSQGFVAETN
jgi:hypothetical protein